MAFSGYVFKSKEEIMPFLEDAENGPSALWAKHQAKRLKSYVCVGYPQKKDDTHFYNSMCFKITIDFAYISNSPFSILQVGLGICMDINPYRFEANFRDFEFANYHLKENTNLILCSMSWLKSDSNPDSTIKYWATRMLPLYQDSEDGRHTIFVACNRTGSERQSTFAGSSCVLDISNESITILNRLGSEDIGIMTVDI
ncbi:hypothetical protein BDF20DRAFT_816461 [Mycotypha africana]|uniref:uncharacterized protein n=1 Tax=Mycotypha africana TaxID=64632 RepID=UPI002300F87D|nr:uncharacterized protein BDF20DRAFT_816461 [Mycotypha africana]KAI8984682.1 hypothetical protein BDF20DRAFT_816461 [Mycotypha africana]